MDAATRHHLQLDDRVAAAAEPVRVLSALSRTADEVDEILRAFQRGAPLPRKIWPRTDHSVTRSELDAVERACDAEHPLGRYVLDCARNLADAAALIENAGTSAFVACTKRLYGEPEDPLVRSVPGSTFTAASHLLERTESLGASCASGEAEYCVVAETVASQIERAADDVFGPGEIEVVIEPSLSARAAASAKRIRLRSGTCFSDLDGPQLVQHELLVHSLTAANGRAQPHLTTLGLGLPRTTRTQEGLAVFAEFITGTMDVIRLRRIAARVVGIGMALDGADLFDVVRFFVSQGQTERESVHSAVRVFRGTDGRGGAAFTKDLVYLQGFVRVHDFLRRAIEDDDFQRAHRLFAGRMTTRDVRRLASAFENDTIAPPLRVPPWVKRRATLAAFLVYDAFVRELHVDAARGEVGSD